MVWKIYQLGYRFHFLVETQPTMDRIRIRETIRMLSLMENPKEHKDFVACKNDERCVVKVKNSELLIGIILHGDDEKDPNLKHSIELVDIINPELL